MRIENLKATLKALEKKLWAIKSYFDIADFKFLVLFL